MHISALHCALARVGPPHHEARWWRGTAGLCLQESMQRRAYRANIARPPLRRWVGPTKHRGPHTSPRPCEVPMPPC